MASLATLPYPAFSAHLSKLGHWITYLSECTRPLAVIWILIKSNSSIENFFVVLNWRFYVHTHPSTSHPSTSGNRLDICSNNFLGYWHMCGCSRRFFYSIHWYLFWKKNILDWYYTRKYELLYNAYAISTFIADYKDLKIEDGELPECRPEVILSL